jgi:alpha-L-fucosidase
MFLSGLLLSCRAQKTDQKYDQSWESLARHNEAPEWFQDAKLGIYFHWGVYSVPAFSGEWYPRNMHRKDHIAHKHHLETYGKLDEFGYHDFVPMFKAEKFNASEWAELFEKAGARFAGPVAEHHDGFAMWDSELTPWNVMDKGPRRDITGELKKAITGKGMKFITTFHHARNLQRYSDQPDEKKFNKSHYPLGKGMQTNSQDDELKYLYGNIPEAEWNRKIWLGKLKEVIDKYQPDIIWFDSWLDQIPEEYRQEFCAYYLNTAKEWGKEVVIVRKQDDLPLDCSVDDLEKSRKNRLEEKVWMTDETISKGSWCYTDNLEIKEYRDVLHVLIDIVSKNGVLLLNISPKADGSIPQDQKDVLLKLGEWLKANGESIYGSRPFTIFGEGPTVEPEGHFKNRKAFMKIKYTPEDIRYTRKGNVVYAHVLGVPKKEVVLSVLAKDQSKVVSNIQLLGSDETVKWKQKSDGLRIDHNLHFMSQAANTFKITLTE